MLVLTRKMNERIVIGENIEVTVVSIRGGRVRLGVTASDDHQIRRSEIVELVGHIPGADSAARGGSHGVGMGSNEFSRSLN